MAHFLGVYLITSVADVAAKSDDPAWLLAGIVFSLVCLAGEVGLGLLVATMLRRHPADPRERFELQVALGACVIAGVGVFFQTLLLIVR